VAKSGDFMLTNDNSDEGIKGKLKDLSIVIGIDASSKDAKCINTLDSFLRKIEQVEKYSLKNKLNMKSNMSGPP
jgi:hypothetical protein